MTRDLNQEFADTETRKYAYEFDYLMHDYMLQTFTPHLPKGKALEMGCYKGEFTKKLATKFTDLTVIEGSSELIAEAKKNVCGSVKFIEGNFETVVFDGQFDAIFLTHTLEHLDNPTTVLKRINSWLTPTGKFFLVVPNANAASRQIAVKMGLIAHNEAVTEGEAAHGHRVTYSLTTLAQEAERGGLKILDRGGVFFKPFANFQFDKLMQTDIIDKAYLDGCYALGKDYPDLCASIYVICGKGG